MVVTALMARIGYDRVARIGKFARCGEHPLETGDGATRPLPARGFRSSGRSGGESRAACRVVRRRRLSGLVKRSFSLAGHRTSVALEQEFWAALMHIAAGRQQTLTALVAAADTERHDGRPLASALRVLALREFFPTALTLF
jgi:predicted DNA-binding ribbon-helix-helix protein